ncbi:serine/threonine protein phosphatase PP2A-associated protein [Trametes versicolor FP-101664 SS1]|uniref:serine/threonine protein phosphatase PP2A-associated protein n=1 Tax=Trametes versicolor (strain FP-101664) TaxID=717944 RepID=UPI00046239F5|nr:serine/threonine protein phosphatase PP2A-associated protein [Trametes versicolor FP-101664 SS1]EIW60242.1 serine/threonine protein phosphatase PP2A-associated protein [Trametes versicolor FP-101664 SS1]
MDELPLSALFRRALASAAKAFDLPTIEDGTQELVRSSLSDLRQCSVGISKLALFSPNEQLADIPTRDLVYLLVPYVMSEVQSRVRAIEREDRLELVKEVKRCLEAYIHYLEQYEIVSGEDKDLYGRPASSVADPAKRRELKIKQYKREKEIKAKIEVARKRTNQSAAEPTSNLELIASILPDPSQKSADSGEDPDADTEEVLRDAVILLLRLIYAEAQTQLERTNEELELLRNAPTLPPQRLPVEDARLGKKPETDDMWRLDGPLNKGGPDGKGPLLDQQGKPLRPFVLLGQNAADRARLQAQVFQPGHRLPTMSVDEYLQIEQQRGNIITGGGAASENEPTSKEQLAMDAEQDGAAFGEEKAEEKRQKDESWAQFTDSNPKGAGNTMNRG